MTPRGTRIALVVSLFFNVFAVGTIGGGLVMVARHQPVATRPAGGRPIRTAGHDLPPADRERFQTLMAQVVADTRPLARAARLNRAEAARLLIAPELDQAALAAALERARQSDFALRTRLENAALGFAASLPAADRATLAAGLERGGPLRGAHP